MARRVSTSDDDQSENGPPAVNVKAERVRKEIRVKTEDAVNDKGKRRARVEEDDEEEEGGYEDAQGEDDVQNEAGRQNGLDGEGSGEDAEGDNDDDEQGSPRGHKRSRIDDGGGSRTTRKDKARERVKTLPRDVDGYIPGSIVRIQLRNFVTYDYVEFRPGPFLNMILGPNGTGKSSIACAICLGLNWSPSILGRATELHSFVKIGTDEGHIEIELKAPKGRQNLIIRRNLSASSKGSTFTLNGQSATGREITTKMAELNVQVGNLCSFLPQDKVSEFAAMSPQQLLRETQRAAGDENLTNWHDTLISAGKELKTMSQTIKEETEQLKQMQERNEGIERDVQRYKDRKKIEHEIELLEVLIPVEEYREMRLKFMETKAKQRMLHVEVGKLRAKNAPAHALLKKLQTQYAEHDKARETIKKATNVKFHKMQAKWAASEKLEGEAEDLGLKLDRLKKDEKERVRKIKNLEGNISRLEAELAKPAVKLEKNEDLVNEMKQINLERSEVIARKEVLEEQLRKNIDNKARLQVQLESAHAELRKLDDVDVRKLSSMYRWNRDTHDAIVWLRKNRHLFKMEVFEPPYMCLSVPDKKFVDAIESCFGANQLRTFVAQCQEDADTFNHHINDSSALGRKARVTTYFRPQQDRALPPPPMSREEMTELGFDGYALDYIDCPPGMHWWLKRELNLHRTAIALNGDKVDVNRAMQAVSRESPNGGGGGATFINGRTINTVSRSRYGTRAIGNMTREVSTARNLIAATIDPEVKQRIDSAISNSRQEINMAEAERGQLDGQMKDVMAEDQVFVKKLNDIQARRKAIRDEQARRGQLEAKLQRNRTARQALLDTPSASEERETVKKALLNITKKRVKIAREYTELARDIITEQTEATRIGLQFLQVGANKQALDVLCQQKDEKFRTALAEFTKVDDAFQAIKAESKIILDKSRRIIAGVAPELREEYSRVEALRVQYDNELAAAEKNGTTPPSAEGVDVRTLEELKAELETQRANLELNLNTNPGVVEQYEKRKRDIEVLEETIEERQRKADKIERNIKNARDNWQPSLEKLVTSIGEKFSAAFDRIGCAGEIRISEHEDYEKWAIDILVKFRDSEKLQLLTGQRQSGGERSLTTILYLMSLTEEARAPFSLVDEINQGMDQRAERMVHNSMVEVTCKPDSAQYFLITPKLLPDLEYHERMKILCVNNGEWLPEERDLGNMMSMIDGFVQRRNRPANAV